MIVVMDIAKISNVEISMHPAIDFHLTFKCSWHFAVMLMSPTPAIVKLRNDPPTQTIARIYEKKYK